MTPYQFASNTPIQAIDEDGLEANYNSAYRPPGQLAPPENAYKSGSESVNQRPVVQGKYDLKFVPKEQPSISAAVLTPAQRAQMNKPKSLTEQINESYDAWDATIGKQLKEDQIKSIQSSPANRFPLIGPIVKGGKFALQGMYKQAAGQLKDLGVEVAFGYGIGKGLSLSSKLLTASKTSTTTVFRNFGWNEYKAFRANGNNFEIGSNFGSKQFWLDDAGIDWWNSTSFSENFTAKITVNNSALKEGYKFLDAGKYSAISFDSKEALDIFNKNMKIEWIQYK